MDLRNTYYLAGFVDGEGHFQICRIENRFQIGLHITQRLDSRAILDNIQAAFGGAVYAVQRSEQGAGAQAQLAIGARQDVSNLISYFDEFPLVVKAEEYQVWKEAALFYYLYGAGKHKAPRETNPNWVVERMEKYIQAIRQLREYNPPLPFPPAEDQSPQHELSLYD